MAGTAIVTVELLVGPVRIQRTAPRTVADLCPFLVPLAAPWTPDTMSGPSDLFDRAWATPPLDGYCRFTAVGPAVGEGWTVSVDVERFIADPDAAARFEGYDLIGGEISLDIPALGDARRFTRTDLAYSDGSPSYREFLAVVRSGRSLMAVRAATHAVDAADSVAAGAREAVLDLAERLTPGLAH